MRTLHRWIQRGAEKVLPLTSVLALLLAVGGVYFVGNESVTSGTTEQLRNDIAAKDERLLALQREIEQLEVEIPPEKERVLRSENVVNQLKQLTSTWSWFGGNRAQQKANVERLAKMETFHADAVAKLTELQQNLRQVRWAHDGLEIEREALLRQLSDEEARRGTFAYWIERAWLTSRGWLCLAFAAYLFGPVLVPAMTRRWRQRRVAAV